MNCAAVIHFCVYYEYHNCWDILNNFKAARCWGQFLVHHCTLDTSSLTALSHQPACLLSPVKLQPYNVWREGVGRVLLLEVTHSTAYKSEIIKLLFKFSISSDIDIFVTFDYFHQKC